MTVQSAILGQNRDKYLHCIDSALEREDSAQSGPRRTPGNAGDMLLI